MEIFELKYFLAVANIENVNKAAEAIHISAGSLSKAIARLEEELQTPLFFKSGRGIRLTPEGTLLKQKAAQILQLEEDTRITLTGKEMGSFNVYISSEEILQTSYGVKIAQKIVHLYPSAKINFLIRREDAAIAQILDNEAHISIITSEPPSEVEHKTIAEVEFKTCASSSHPLFKKYSTKQTISVDEVLKHSFVVPQSTILGRISKATSVDGWRDDKFPRLVKYKSCGLKVMENILQEGLALGYLPDYYVEAAGLVPIKVSGCPYSCKQSVKVIAKDPSSLSWLNRVWDKL